jgi:hypothetical protein
MIDIMEKYGPTEWRGVTREPWLDFDMLRKERDINGVRQTFLRWNPDFEDDWLSSTLLDGAGYLSGVKWPK